MLGSLYSKTWQVKFSKTFGERTADTEHVKYCQSGESTIVRLKTSYYVSSFCIRVFFGE